MLPASISASTSISTSACGHQRLPLTSTPQGACVCDESSLTGEAHPVQKIEAPNDMNAKVTEKGAQRFTLYSGTTLLQVERGEHDDALAVVTATGIQTGKGQLISHILYPQRILFKYDEELPVVAAVLIVYALIVFPIAIWFQVSNKML